MCGLFTEERFMKRVILSLFVVLYASTALAETGFQLAVPNVNLPDDPAVNGMRLSFLHGRNQSMSGFDLGVLSMSETHRMSGLALVAGIHRVNSEMDSGAVFSLVNYHRGRDSGLNGAFINLLHNTEGAFNIGFVNVASDATLADLGGFNMSKRSTAQIGFLNITKEIRSFQFGFLNMAENGFLPIFPIFNFPKP